MAVRRAVGRVATLNRSPKWRNPPCGRSGPVLAARLIGRCGRAFRFRTADAFASYAGTAPVEASAADTSPRSTDNTTCNFRSGVLFADLDISISLHQIGSAAPVQRATTEFRPPTDSQDAAHHAWPAHTTAFSGTHRQTLFDCGSAQARGARHRLETRIFLGWHERETLAAGHPVRVSPMQWRREPGDVQALSLCHGIECESRYAGDPPRGLGVLRRWVRWRSVHRLTGSGTALAAN